MTATITIPFRYLPSLVSDTALPAKYTCAKCGGLCDTCELPPTWAVAPDCHILGRLCPECVEVMGDSVWDSSWETVLHSEYPGRLQGYNNFRYPDSLDDYDPEASDGDLEIYAVLVEDWQSGKNGLARTRFDQDGNA